MVDLVGGLSDAYQGVAGVADHAAGSVDESVDRQFDDEEGGGFGDFFVGDDRDDFVLQPGTAERSIYDTLFDYEGEWGHSEDTEDLIGPSWDWRDIGEGYFGTGVDHRADNPNDPTNPDNWGRNMKLILVGLASLAAIYILGQLVTFNIGGGTGA